MLEHGGRCPLDALQAVFGDKDPTPALHWLVQQKFLTVEGTETRVMRDKQLEYASLAVTRSSAENVCPASTRFCLLAFENFAFLSGLGGFVFAFPARRCGGRNVSYPQNKK